MSGINQLKYKMDAFNSQQYQNKNPKTVVYQNVGYAIPYHQQIRTPQPQQIIQYPNQQMVFVQSQPIAGNQRLQYHIPNQQVQHQLEKNYKQQQIQIMNQNNIQQQQLLLQRTQANLKNQQLIPQNINRIQPNIKDIQLIMPQQILEYSAISNIQSIQTSPWFQPTKEDSNFLLPLSQNDKLRSISANNLDSSAKNIQEIKPFKMNNYSKVLNKNNQDESHQICHTFNQVDSNYNSNHIQNMGNKSQDIIMNISFSQEQGQQLGSDKSRSPLRGFPQSPQPGYYNQEISILQSMQKGLSPAQQYSPISNNPSIIHHIPVLSFQNNAFNQNNSVNTLHARSKSVLSPVKSARNTYVKSTDQNIYFSPLRVPITDRNYEINNSSTLFRNTTPKQMNSGLKESNNNDLLTQQSIIIPSNVGLQYISKNNPVPHFNDHPAMFHNSPERSKDAVSCVFINTGTKKMPSKIKIKYTPVESLLTKDELQEYQSKHKELNLVSNKQNSENQEEQQNNLNKFNTESQQKQNQNPSLNVLVQSIDFFSTKGNTTPDKRTPLADIIKNMDPIKEEHQ